MDDVTQKALRHLRDCRNRLTPQQYKVLKGQIAAGDVTGALKGLRKLLKRVSV